MRPPGACDPRTHPPAEEGAFAPPDELTASVLEIGGDTFAVLEWRVARRSFPAGLSPAEREVAELVLTGLSNAEIAKRRGRSRRTVANQVAALFKKLGVESRAGLVARARGRR